MQYIKFVSRGLASLLLCYIVALIVFEIRQRGANPMRKSTRLPILYVDPVCWKLVASEGNALRIHYRMRGYYFCSEACLKVFRADPERYLRIEPAHKKGWVKRCLKRFTDGIQSHSSGIYRC